MKKSGLLLFLPLMTIFLMSFVSAQAYSSSFIDQPASLGPIFDALFGMTGPVTWGDWIAVIVVFILLFVAFGDIIRGFTAFSTPVAWIIAGGIAIIAALTRVIVIVAMGLMRAVAFLGVFSVIGVIAFAFAAFFALHWFTGKLFAWFAIRQAQVKAYKSTGYMIEGMKGLKKAGKELAKG